MDIKDAREALNWVDMKNGVIDRKIFNDPAIY